MINNFLKIFKASLSAFHFLNLLKNIFLKYFLGPRGPLVEPSISPSTRPPATIFPEFIDELKHFRQASGTPQIVHFLKADDVSYPNSDENTNTKTNTETNTNTETKTGKTNYSYDVIYF